MNKARVDKIPGSQSSNESWLNLAPGSAACHIVTRQSNHFTLP